MNSNSNSNSNRQLAPSSSQDERHPRQGPFRGFVFRLQIERPDEGDSPLAGFVQRALVYVPEILFVLKTNSKMPQLFFNQATARRLMEKIRYTCVMALT